MTRREFIAGAAAWPAVAWPMLAVAQARPRPLIGSLAVASAATARPQHDAFFEGLRSLGYVEGRDFDFQARWADGHNERLPQLAQGLVALKPDVIFANPIPAVMAVKAASQAIPIVCFMLADEIRLGLAASDARPAGNVTGLLMRVQGMAGKQIELATETLPTAKRIGVLFNPTSADAAAQHQEVEAAILTRSVQPLFVEARTSVDIEDAIRRMVDEKVEIVVVMYDALFFTNRRRIAALAASARLPMAYSARDHVDAGGLISYGVSLRANARRAATFVAKILNGEKPGDLPIEFPTTLELVINLKTANALGLTLPPTLLARADEVIE